MFRELKKRFTKEPILAALDLDKKKKVEVDTLDYVIDEILSIEYKNGK